MDFRYVIRKCWLPAVTLSFIAGATAITVYHDKKEAQQGVQRAELIRNLESNAPYVQIGCSVEYKDTDGNGKFETWCKDSTTGKEYKLVLPEPAKQEAPAR